MACAPHTNSIILTICIYVRNFCVTEGSYQRSECGRNIAGYMGDLWLLIDDRCTLLCWIGNSTADFGRWLCLHQRGLRRISRFSLLMGRLIHFCVSFTLCNIKRTTLITLPYLYCGICFRTILDQRQMPSWDWLFRIMCFSHFSKTVTCPLKQHNS